MPIKDNPPLGVMPRYQHDRKRKEALKDAMYRYLDEDFAFPVEWLEEYNEIVERERKENEND